jgi:hypothetical protein
MAYVHGYEVHVIPSMTASTVHPTANVQGVRLDVTGLAGSWGPGYVPHVVHGAAVVKKTQAAQSNAVHVAFDADLTTPGTATRAFKIVVPTTVTGGTAVHYTATYSIILNPGDSMQANVTAAATNGTYGHVTLYVSPSFEKPGTATWSIATT